MRILACALALALAACGGAGPGLSTSEGQSALSPGNNLQLGVPHVMPLGNKAPLGSAATSPHLTYYGGKVVPNVNVHVVFWGSGVNATTVAQIPGFFSSVTQSPYFDWLSEYNTPTQSIGRGSLGSVHAITPANIAPILTNADIATELGGQIQAGNLPQPDGNAFYMVYFPPTVVIQLDAVDYSCVQFCAYHNTAILNGKEFYYGVMPDLSVGACSLGCGAAANPFDNLTSVSSHELIETVTDAEVGLAGNTLGPPLAWYDSNNGEIGDICNAQQGQVTGSDGKTFTVQKEWSNQANACIVHR